MKLLIKNAISDRCSTVWWWYKWIEWDWVGSPDGVGQEQSRLSQLPLLVKNVAEKCAVVGEVGDMGEGIWQGEVPTLLSSSPFYILLYQLDTIVGYDDVDGDGDGK